MEEPKEASQTSKISDVPPSFLEVTCKCSGIVRRFAPGTKAGFAVSLINNKLDVGNPLVLYIEAAKIGEEPINFGPSSVLLNYGNGWKLQTVLDSQQGIKKREGAQVVATNKHEDAQAMNTRIKKGVTVPAFDFMYIGKILVAFLFIFLMAAVCTLALENLPNLMLFINSF